LNLPRRSFLFHRVLSFRRLVVLVDDNIIVTASRHHYSTRAERMSHQQQQQQQQYQRRTFRGRAGPTDGRLPKFNAARRRPHFGDEQQVAAVAAVAAVAPKYDGPPPVKAREEAEEQQQHGESGAPKEDQEDPLQIELAHLKTRIRNNRNAMSLSATALANPTNYQNNVLSACQNTVTEWRSIRKHYKYSLLDDSNSERSCSSSLLALLFRSTGQDIFELLQQSLQCGPLAGSQPGYFKRCGVEVAMAVHAYLEAVVVDCDDATETLGFTEKQAAAVDTWKRNARKAIEKNQSPSKSVIQKQQKAMANSKKKNKT